MAARLVELVLALASVASPFIMASSLPPPTSPHLGSGTHSIWDATMMALPLIASLPSTGSAEPVAINVTTAAASRKMLDRALQLVLDSSTSLLQRVPACIPYRLPYNASAAAVAVAAEGPQSPPSATVQLLGPSSAAASPSAALQGPFPSPGGDLLSSFCCPALLGLGMRLLITTVQPMYTGSTNAAAAAVAAR